MGHKAQKGVILLNNKHIKCNFIEILLEVPILYEYVHLYTLAEGIFIEKKYVNA